MLSLKQGSFLKKDHFIKKNKKTERNPIKGSSKLALKIEVQNYRKNEINVIKSKTLLQKF